MAPLRITLCWACLAGQWSVPAVALSSDLEPAALEDSSCELDATEESHEVSLMQTALELKSSSIAPIKSVRLAQAQDAVPEAAPAVEKELPAPASLVAEHREAAFTKAAVPDAAGAVVEEPPALAGVVPAEQRETTLTKAQAAVPDAAVAVVDEPPALARTIPAEQRETTLTKASVPDAAVAVMEEPLTLARLILAEQRETTLTKAPASFLVEKEEAASRDRSPGAPFIPDAGADNPELKAMRETLAAREEVYSFPTIASVAIVLSAMLAIAVHEFLVSQCCQQPALAISLPERAWWLRWVLLAAQCQNFVEVTTFIPLSYDLALTLGTASPGAFSGLLIGLCFFAFAPGGLIAKKTLPEADWNQVRWRERMLYAYALDIMCHLATTGFLTVGVITHPMLLFWTLAALRTCNGLCIGYNMIGVMTLMQRITPPCLRGDASILSQVMRNSGFMLGPGLCSVTLFMFDHMGIEATVFEETATTSLALAGTTAMLMALFSLAIPLDAPDAEGSPGTSTDGERPGQERLEDFPDPTRRQLVWLLTSYGAERAFTIAGVEVASLMMLETMYGWSVEWCGFALTGVAGVSTVGCLVLLLLLRTGVVGEKNTFLMLATCSLFGGALLFQVSKFGSISLLMADLAIYCSASVANGIADGWTKRAVKPGTDFSNEEQLKIMVMSVTFSRLISPPLSRVLIELGGRNAYALMQIILIIMGFSTVVKVVWIVQCTDAVMKGRPSLGFGKMEAALASQPDAFEDGSSHNQGMCRQS